MKAKGAVCDNNLDNIHAKYIISQARITSYTNRIKPQRVYLYLVYNLSKQVSFNSRNVYELNKRLIM